MCYFQIWHRSSRKTLQLLFLCLRDLGITCSVKSLIFRGLHALAAKPRLAWEVELEGAGRDEPVKFPFLCLDSFCISRGEHGHEMKGRGQEALTAMSEVTLLGSFGVCSFELLSLWVMLLWSWASSEFKVLTKKKKNNKLTS